MFRLSPVPSVEAHMDDMIGKTIVPSGSQAPQMHHDESSSDTKVIRQLLNEAFDDGEITDLCFDNFRPVYDRFSEGMDKFPPG